jgi:hypothetical protein
VQIVVFIGFKNCPENEEILLAYAEGREKAEVL